MCVATPAGQGWMLAAPELVGDVTTLFARLRVRAAGAPVALGIDCPIGVPRGYAAGMTAPNFPSFLRTLTADSGFFEVAATLDAVSPLSPFYPARGVRGMTRLAHAQALGLDGAAALCRACDHATAERPAGAPLFWTLGANQSGKAAIAAWRDLLIPALHSPSPPRLWPFEGPFRALLAPGGIAVAETYPAEARRHLGIKPAGSKRRQSDRAAYGPAILEALPRLRATAAPALTDRLCNGFGASAAGEDQFDSVLGVLCVLGVLTGQRPDTAPADPQLTKWEGWVLGQTALPVKKTVLF
jgi:hypothetical protein